MKRLKVLHVIPAVAPRYGGPSQVLYTMSQALQSLGVEILIATTNADFDTVLPVTLGRKIIYQEVPTIFFSRQWSEALKYSRPLAEWLDHHIKDFDLVHIHAVFSHACIAAARICRKYKIPYLVRPLGTLDPWSLKQKWFRKQLFLFLGAKKMLQEATAVHYTASEEKRLAEEGLGLSNGVVVPNGIDFGLVTNDDDVAALSENRRQNPYILALSRIHPKKGYELLIESFAALKRQGKIDRWQLVFAGDGELDYVNQLKTMVERNNLSQSVLFVGWVKGEEKKSVLQKASLFALPSYQENFGISLVEAMACGVPVLISSHVNLAPEITQADAGWVTSLDQKAFSSALSKALDSQQERQCKGARALELAQSFSSGEVATKLLSLYRDLAIEH